MCCPPASTSGGSRLHGRGPQPGIPAQISANSSVSSTAHFRAVRVALTLEREPYLHQSVVTVRCRVSGGDHRRRRDHHPYAHPSRRKSASCTECQQHGIRPPPVRTERDWRGSHQRQSPLPTSSQSELCVCDYGAAGANRSLTGRAFFANLQARAGAVAARRVHRRNSPQWTVHA